MDEALKPTFDRLAGELVSRVDELTEGYLERLNGEEPVWGRGRPELIETYRELTRASILAELECFRDGREVPAEVAKVDLDIARGAARAGAPPTLLGDNFRRGHACHWDAWFALVEASVHEPDDRRALTLEEYTRERDLMLRDREHRRVHLVHELLAGREVDPVVLGHDPSGANLALVGWGPGAADAARAAGELLRRPLLLVGIVENELFGWLGGRAGDDTEQRLSQLEVPEGSGLAFGYDTVGVVGFALSHQQARQAQRGTALRPSRHPPLGSSAGVAGGGRRGRRSRVRGSRAVRAGRR